MEEEKKKDGRGGARVGNGRKAGVKVGAYKGGKDYAQRKPCLVISGYKEELDRLRQIALDNNETLSRYILNYFHCLNEQNQ